MRTILVIGIGAGDPDFLTVQAIEALNRAEIFFIPDKGAEKAGLKQLRTDICKRFIRHENYRMIDVPIPQRASAESGYRGSIDDWHAALVAGYEKLFRDELPEDGCGALLVWGDPALYDSTLRIIDRLQAGGVPLECKVIPGISAIQVLAAKHKIALNTIGEPILITTGRKLATEGFPAGIDSVVVMLDGELAFAAIAPDGLEIYWGAYLGTPDEILIAGKLGDVAAEIEKVRAKARAEIGWIMDTYLLRRTAA